MTNGVAWINTTDCAAGREDNLTSSFMNGACLAVCLLPARCLGSNETPWGFGWTESRTSRFHLCVSHLPAEAGWDGNAPQQAKQSVCANSSTASESRLCSLSFSCDDDDDDDDDGSFLDFGFNSGSFSEFSCVKPDFVGTFLSFYTKRDFSNGFLRANVIFASVHNSPTIFLRCFYHDNKPVRPCRPA